MWFWSVLWLSLFGGSTVFGKTFQNSKTCKDHENKAAVARWMMRKNDWGSIATISTIDSMKGQPFSNIISFNEGLEGVSTGVPYFFITDMDQSMHDLKSHNFLSLSVSEYQEKIENISC